MKRFFAILCAVLLLLGMSACGQSDEMAAENERLRQAIESAEADKAALEEELAAAREHADRLQGELSELWGKYYDISDELDEALEPKWKSIVCGIEEKDFKGAILRSDRLYMDPWIDAELKDLREGQYVEILLKIWVMDSVTGEMVNWYLVTWKALSEPGTPFVDFGWVPAESLEEYTYENMKEIIGPVSLKEGTVVYDDEALTAASQYPPPMEANFTVLDLGNGVCMVGAAGYGAAFYVRASDVIYPTP